MKQWHFILVGGFRGSDSKLSLSLKLTQYLHHGMVITCLFIAIGIIIYTRLQHIIYITRSTYTNNHHQRESDTPYLANTRVKNPLLQLFRCLYDFPYWLWLMLFDETESFNRPRDFEVKRGQIVERLCVIKSIWAMHLKETSWKYSSDKLF